MIFFLASCNALILLSTAIILRSGNCDAIETAIQPLPVPTSAIKPPSLNLAIDKSNIKLKDKFYYDTDPTLLTAQIEKLTRYSQRKQNLQDEISRLENSSDKNKSVSSRSDL